MKYSIVTLTHNSDPYNFFDSIKAEYLNNFNIPHTCIFSNSSKEMFKNFITFLKTNKTWSEYDYILRVNSSTFLNIPKLEEAIKLLPKQNCYAGHYGDIINNILQPIKPTDFVSGTCIIFSRDVLRKLSEIDTHIAFENDDLEIFRYMTQFNIPRIPIHMYWYDNNQLPTSQHILDILNKYPLLRIKNNENREIDKQIWTIAASIDLQNQ
jgi:hypothetical protein